MIGTFLDPRNYLEFAVEDLSPWYQPWDREIVQADLEDVERQIADLEAGKPLTREVSPGVFEPSKLEDEELDNWERRNRLEDLKLEARLLREQLEQEPPTLLEMRALQYRDERLAVSPYEEGKYRHPEEFLAGVRLAIESLEHADDLRTEWWIEQYRQAYVNAQDSWLRGKPHSEETQRELDRLLGAKLMDAVMLEEWGELERRVNRVCLDQVCEGVSENRSEGFDPLFVQAAKILSKATFPKSDDRTDLQKEFGDESPAERKAFKSIASKLAKLRDGNRMLSHLAIEDCLQRLRRARPKPRGTGALDKLAVGAIAWNASSKIPTEDYVKCIQVSRYEWNGVDFDRLSAQFIASWVQWINSNPIEFSEDLEGYADSTIETGLHKWDLLSWDEVAMIQHRKACDEATQAKQAATGSKARDPYHVPGLVEAIMNWTLGTAAYPSRELAFCGAISLVSLLVGRKVTYNHLAPNVYLIAIASSGSGKNRPREVNSELLQRIGLGECVNEAIASGEGLEDAIADNPLCLLQADELDHLIRAIAGSRESRFQSIAERMLRLFTSSNSTYYVRRRAGMPQRSISRPYLVLYGTCTPGAYWDSLSLEMLANGLFARMITVHVPKRGDRQSSRAIEPDEGLLQELQFWKDFEPSAAKGQSGNLAGVLDSPYEIPADEDAKACLDAARDRFDSHYRSCEAKQDEAGMSIWARAGEHAIKLAAIYACSIASGEPPRVTLEAIEWATRFMEQHTAKILEQARERVTDSEQAKLQTKIIDKLRSSPDGCDHSELLRYTRLSSKEFREVMGTLIESGRVEKIDRNGRTHYILGPHR